MPLATAEVMRIYQEELAGKPPASQDTTEEAKFRKKIREEIKSTKAVLDIPSDWLDMDEK